MADLTVSYTVEHVIAELRISLVFIDRANIWDRNLEPIGLIMFVRFSSWKYSSLYSTLCVLEVKTTETAECNFYTSR